MLRLAVASFLTLACCAPPLQSKLGIKDWNSLKIRLDRGMCYGICPWYRLEIGGNGHVTFCGLAYVKEQGARTRTIPQTDVQALTDAFADAKFFELNDEYIDGPTDGAMYSVSISYDGRSKEVRHYSGSDLGGELLDALEGAIDVAARADEWIGDRESISTGGPASIPDCARELGIEPPEPMPPAPL